MSQNDPDHYPIIIVGSGPAGISTALHLISRQPEFKQQILILEKSVHPRKKLCGGGISSTALGWLDSLGIGLPVPALRLAQTRIILEDGEQVAGGFPIVCREEFDAALCLKAIEAGIQVAQGEQVLSVDDQGEQVLLRTNRRVLSAQVVVGADGANSIVRRSIYRRLKLRPADNAARFLRYLLPVDQHCPEHRDSEAIFDIKIASKHGHQGYAWSFPFLIQGQPWLNLGLGDGNISGRKVHSLMPAFIEFLANKGIPIQPEAFESCPSRWFNPSNPISTNRSLLVGDAAGVDPLWLDGIGSSLIYGSLAARAIHQAFEQEDFTFPRFKEDVLADPNGQKFLLQYFSAARFYHSRGQHAENATWSHPPGA